MKNRFLKSTISLLLAGMLSSTIAFAAESPFKSNGSGTLSAKSVENHPVMPWWGPATPESSAYNYKDIDFVAVSYSTDKENAAKLIPEELELLALPGMPTQSAVNLIFAKYRENDKTGPYMETIVAIPVLLKGMPYLYVVAIYVDNDAALIAGREFGGYPKKLAKITMHNYGNLFLSRIERQDSQRKTADAQFADLASSNVSKGGKLFSIPLPANDIKQLPFPYNMLLPLPPATGKPQSYVLPTIGLRTVPGVGKDALKTQEQQLIGTPWVITKATVWEGKIPSMDLHATLEDPLAKMLPVNAVLASYILRGDMYTDPTNWMILKDYKAK
jgi:hypothetical protein